MSGGSGEADDEFDEAEAVFEPAPVSAADERRLR